MQTGGGLAGPPGQSDAAFFLQHEWLRITLINVHDGFVVELFNHSLPIATVGRERPIDGCACSKRNAHGEVFGTARIFPDVTNADCQSDSTQPSMRLGTSIRRFARSCSSTISTRNTAFRRVKRRSYGLRLTTSRRSTMPSAKRSGSNLYRSLKGHSKSGQVGDSCLYWGPARRVECLELTRSL